MTPVAGTDPYDLVIRGGRVVLPDGEREVDLGIRDGRIVEIGRNLGPTHRDYDATGRLVLPGGVDTHCHMDQPPWEGLSTADDFASGTLLGACGGTTTVVPFVMQRRGESLRDCVAAYHLKAAAKAHIDYSFHLIIADPAPQVLEAELPELVAEGCASIKLYMTYEGLRLDDAEVLRVLDAARREGAFVMVHAENDGIIRWATDKLLLSGRTAMRSHAVSRPGLGEAEATHRAIAFAELGEVPILIAHVSAAAAVEELRRAQARGVEVFAETCPQYLFLSDADLASPGLEGARCICTPPPRSFADQRAVYEGLLDGTLPVFSSDHSSWRSADKMKDGPATPFTHVPNGIPGIETRLPLLFSDAVNGGRMSLQTFVDRTSTRPARLCRPLPAQGRHRLGLRCRPGDLGSGPRDHAHPGNVASCCRLHAL